MGSPGTMALPGRETFSPSIAAAWTSRGPNIPSSSLKHPDTPRSETATGSPGIARHLLGEGTQPLPGGLPDFPDPSYFPCPRSPLRPRQSAGGEQWPAIVPGPAPPLAAAAPAPPRPGRPSPLNFPRALATSAPRRAAAVRTAPRPSRQVPHKHSLPSEPPKSLQTARPGIPGTAPEKSPPPPPLLSRSHLAQLPPSLARPPAPPASPPSFLLPTPPRSANAHPRPLPLPQSQTRAEPSTAAGSQPRGRADLRGTSRRRGEAPPQRSEAAGGRGYSTPGRSVRMR